MSTSTIQTTAGFKGNLDPKGDALLRESVAEWLREIRARASNTDAAAPWRWYPKNRFITFYVRISPMRSIQVKGSKVHRVYASLELAAIEVNPQYQRRGLFRHVLSELQSIAKDTGRILYVENVLNEMLYAKFRKDPEFKQLMMVGGYSDDCFAYIPEHAKPSR